MTGTQFSEKNNSNFCNFFFPGDAGSNSFVETLRERLFRPSLSTIIPDSTK